MKTKLLFITVSLLAATITIFSSCSTSPSTDEPADHGMDMQMSSFDPSGKNIVSESTDAVLYRQPLPSAGWEVQPKVLYSKRPGATKDDKPTGSISGVVKHRWLRRVPYVVYLDPIDDAEFDVPEDNPLMDQKQSTFVPKILPILVGTTVDFHNDDPFTHNVFSPEGEYDLGNWGQGQQKEYEFKETGIYTQLCRLHPQMIAYIIVSETPFAAVIEAGSDGSFALEDVPVGRHGVRVWSERLTEEQIGKSYTVTVRENQAASVTIEP
ncbi:MAG: hypothetical protein NUW37_11225 [Planctomycetes bacterium]|nr:hypothetical protein [Planctomycetota bacterium]